jgi:hypothetical protein
MATYIYNDIQWKGAQPQRRFTFHASSFEAACHKAFCWARYHGETISDFTVELLNDKDIQEFDTHNEYLAHLKINSLSLARD